METLTPPVAGQPSSVSPLSQETQQLQPSEGLEVSSTTPQAMTEGERRTTDRTASTSSTKVDQSTATPSRSGTLKKNTSLRKRTSLSRRSSRRSLGAGEIRRVGPGESADEFNNIFHTPIPTTGNPTEILANRFQAWRKLLKDLITYFREIQTSYEQGSKSLLKISNVVNNTHSPQIFMSQGGLNDAITTLRGFHKVSLTEANKARDIEDDVITQLNGLRNDLNQKIKEIKSLSDDFKNSVEKKKESTRKAVGSLQDALSSAESEPSSSSGKNDPYIVRLGVERQVELQVEEENYLHRAYLNLEGSGRELESIVVGEIQKAYNAYVGILRRQSEHAQETIDTLRSGPIAMPKDHEWANFVQNDSHFVNPNVPLRRFEDMYYPGKFSPAAMEIRSGMLERKSKYLKSYTPGWYVLSATHLHEFKSGDHLHTQTPVMSLYLLDQKLGSRSQPDATSHKFSFKGRQTGAMHRGHSWVFRAESHDTMMAWYSAIEILTEKTSAERNAFVRKHARSVSGGSYRRASVSSDGIDEDEADAQPYNGNLPADEVVLGPVKRPEPGGRFPSDVDVNRGLQAPISPSSNGSSESKDNTVKGFSPRSTDQMPTNRLEVEGVDRKDYYPGLGLLDHRPANDEGSWKPNGIPAQTNSSDSAAPISSEDPKPMQNETVQEGVLPQTQELSAMGAYSSNTTPALGHNLQENQGGDYVVASADRSGTLAQGDKPSHTARGPSPDGVPSGSISVLNHSSVNSMLQGTALKESVNQIAPTVLRNATTKSDSELHVPGGFPLTPAAED